MLSEEMQEWWMERRTSLTAKTIKFNLIYTKKDFRASKKKEEKLILNLSCWMLFIEIKLFLFDKTESVGSWFWQPIFFSHKLSSFWRSLFVHPSVEFQLHLEPLLVYLLAE